MHSRLFIFTLFALSFLCSEGQSQILSDKSDPAFLGYNQKWVDSVFNKLSPDERIGQLIMVAAYSNRGKAEEDTILSLIKKYKVGGVIFFQGGPVRQARLTNLYQSQSKVPMMVAMDCEWGLAMRLDSTVRFPYQMSLGAIQENDSLIYQMGADIAKQFKRLGMHVNFAPVVDVNNNPNNPVINFRSFGEDKYKVTEKSYAYMKGLQDNGIIATAKHFPGHGDTDADSHFTLPLIAHNRQRLDSLELYPFRELINRGMGGVMVAHLSIPALDSTKNQASTLSKPIVTNLLKKELGFKGLIFTDAMNMEGVAKFYKSGIADLKAILAGNDILEFSKDIPAVIREIKLAVKNGQISQRDIDQRCRRVLAAKAWVGLDHYQPVDLTNLVADLNSPASEVLNRKLAEASLTLLRNERQLIPLLRLDTLKIASLSLGSSTLTPFQQMLGNYSQLDHFNLTADSKPADVDSIRAKLKKYNLVLVGIHGLSIRPPKNYGLTPQLAALIKEFSSSGKAIVSIFGNAYLLAKMEGLEQAAGLVMAYQENIFTQELTAQLLFGGAQAKGKLPVSVTPAFKRADGLLTPEPSRFKYTLPEEVGIDAKVLHRRIDSLVNVAILSKAIPGCQVLVAKEGKVIFQKSYGFHTYDNQTPVSNTDVYDLASITKVSASLPALMRLQDEGKFDPDKTLGDYLPELFKGSNKENLKFRDILTHQARLKAWIPFWMDTKKKNGKFKWATFKERATPSKRFPVQVAENLYLHRNYSKKIYKAIVDSPLNEKPGYVYSDFSFYLYPLIVKKLTGQDFEPYLKETFYRPLGAYSLTYNARKVMPLSQIVPSEYDSLFRKELIHGRVHDEGATMLNGLSGHAGLFGNANDLAKLMQMYLQKGVYGSRRFISEKTMLEYERCQFCPENRRALGFDRPIFPASANGNAAPSASAQSFGHTGFTGTFTWVDPAYKLVYIFLSNRVYPTRNNTKLYTLNTRTNIQQVIYDAILSGQKQPSAVGGK